MYYTMVQMRGIRISYRRQIGRAIIIDMMSTQGGSENSELASGGLKCDSSCSYWAQTEDRRADASASWWEASWRARPPFTSFNCRSSPLIVRRPFIPLHELAEHLEFQTLRDWTLNVGCLHASCGGCAPCSP
ncbi:hypothetical protein K466DRAFT_181794 [Polyporus arcularius HHB13444]|uniref:Uncharacterized protein n=1 Tax=Polyporus arcularius HHB13444 TaxID=1314778 RepID=A0A5C3PYH5_9APHY|nr:hypothetical protein K466DRAFT_181794 [Polyporus arcularius HHB13444]